MSKIYIMNIVGTGVYDDPSSDAELVACTTNIDGRLSNCPTVTGLTYDTVEAFVRDGADGSGGEGTRTLNAIVDGFYYNLSAVPSEADTDTMCTAIRNALTQLVDCPWERATSVGEIRINAWYVDPV